MKESTPPITDPLREDAKQKLERLKKEIAEVQEQIARVEERLRDPHRFDHDAARH